jgi:tetratricopeptide (TPR) repeat protein
MVHKRAFKPFLCLAFSCLAWGVNAEPWQPRSDLELIETLPAETSARKDAARARQAMLRSPKDAALAVAAASRYLALAREQGDARYAGLALGALQAWPLGKTAPTEVLVMRATVAQYLHDFDGAAALLRQVLTREPAHAQALLTLATIKRVQARFDESDAACQALLRAGQALHAKACLAENLSLRGKHEEARQALAALLAQTQAREPSAQALRQWLLTTQAEMHERAGQPREAEASWQQAMALGDHPYVRTAYADFLLQQGRPQEVMRLLAEQPQTDAVLLRLCIAAKRVQDPRAPAWAQDMQQRLAASASRPDGAQVHAREQARFALDVKNQPEQALALARLNLQHQRETADLLVFARASAALPAPDQVQAARRELAQSAQTWGMQDARLSN